MPNLFKSWSTNGDFDLWTHSGAGAYNNGLVVCNKSIGCSRAADVTFSIVTALQRHTDDGLICVLDAGNGTCRVNSGSLTSGTVRMRAAASANAGAGVRAEIMMRRSNDSNFYLANLSGGANWYIQKNVGGVTTTLASLAHVETAGTEMEFQLAYNSSTGALTLTETVPHSATLSTTDLSLSAGGSGYGFRFPQIYGYHVKGIQDVGGTSGTSTSNTFDAGASVDADTLFWDVSLPAGATAGVKVSLVASGSPSLGSTITLSNGRSSATFTELTGQYLQAQVSMGGGAMLKELGVTKGNDPGSGGGSGFFGTDLATNDLGGQVWRFGTAGGSTDAGGQIHSMRLVTLTSLTTGHAIITDKATGHEIARLNFDSGRRHDEYAPKFPIPFDGLVVSVTGSGNVYVQI